MSLLCCVKEKARSKDCSDQSYYIVMKGSAVARTIHSASNEALRKRIHASGMAMTTSFAVIPSIP
jgi:hypothetical protein